MIPSVAWVQRPVSYQARGQGIQPWSRKGCVQACYQSVQRHGRKEEGWPNHQTSATNIPHPVPPHQVCSGTSFSIGRLHLDLDPDLRTYDHAFSSPVPASSNFQLLAPFRPTCVDHLLPLALSPTPADILNTCWVALQARSLLHPMAEMRGPWMCGKSEVVRLFSIFLGYGN